MSRDDSQWKTVAETAAHFRVGRKTVYAKCKSKAWPHHRTGTHIRAAIRFSPEDWDTIALLMRAPTQVLAVSTAPTAAQLARAARRLNPARAAAGRK